METVYSIENKKEAAVRCLSLSEQAREDMVGLDTEKFYRKI